MINKTLKLLCIVFLAIGLVFATVGAGLHIGFTAKVRSWTPVNGHIVSFSYGNPVVGYQYNGYEGTLRSNTHTSWQRIGDTVKLYVDPADPANADDGTMPLVGVIFLIIGACMLVTPVVIVLMRRAQNKKLALLSTYGQRVKVTVTEVKPNYTMTVNGRHPIRVWAQCRHPFTGEEIAVHSRNLWQTSCQPGDTVEVLFDPMNEKRYAMDVQEDA